MGCCHTKLTATKTDWFPVNEVNAGFILSLFRLLTFQMVLGRLFSRWNQEKCGLEDTFLSFSPQRVKTQYVRLKLLVCVCKLNQKSWFWLRSCVSRCWLKYQQYIQHVFWCSSRGYLPVVVLYHKQTARSRGQDTGTGNIHSSSKSPLPKNVQELLSTKDV